MSDLSPAGQVSRVDLHLHSSASDGVHSPAELVAVSLRAGLHTIAIADHDTTGGIEEAVRAARGTALTVIAGVEISAQEDDATELHILGYGVDPSNERLQQRLGELRRSRRERASRMLELLERNGVALSWDRVATLAAGGSVGRPHIAQALVEADHVDSVETAFRRYLGQGRAAYVPRAKVLPREAIDLIRGAGGVPVLAHPSRAVERIPALVRAGLMGLEVYYYGYADVETRFLAKLARKHGLVATGGTDYHGPGITNAPAPGACYVPERVVAALLACRERVRNAQRQDR